MKYAGERRFDCITGRGAGAQFIMMCKALDLLIVTTAHKKGTRKALQTIPKRILPSFIH